MIVLYPDRQINNIYFYVLCKYDVSLICLFFLETCKKHGSDICLFDPPSTLALALNSNFMYYSYCYSVLNVFWICDGHKDFTDLSHPYKIRYIWWKINKQTSPLIITEHQYYTPEKVLFSILTIDDKSNLIEKIKIKIYRIKRTIQH